MREAFFEERFARRLAFDDLTETGHDVPEQLPAFGARGPEDGRHLAVVIELDGHIPWAAANLTVLDVILTVAAAGVEQQLDRLTAVRTPGVGRRVGYTIAERKALVEPLVIILP